MKSDAEKKLERIERKNRERARKFLAKAKAQGKKHISALISGEAYNILCQIREDAKQAGNPLSVAKIIEQALACYAESIDQSKKPIREIHPEIHGPESNK